MFLFIDDQVILLVDGDYQFDGDSLVSTDIVSGVAEVDSATLSAQSTGDNLVADTISVTPIVNDTNLLQVVQLFSNDILSGHPVVDSALLTPIFDNEELFSDDISIIPLVDSSLLSQIHDLDSDEIESGIPVIDQANIAFSYNLIAQEIINQNPTIDQATINQIHILNSLGISVTPIVESPFFYEGDFPTEIVSFSILLGKEILPIVNIKKSVYNTIDIYKTVANAVDFNHEVLESTKLQQKIEEIVQVIK
jgi:hypothetical protein